MLDRLEELERQVRYLTNLPMIAKHIAEVNAAEAKVRAEQDAKAKKEAREKAKADRDAKLAAAQKDASQTEPPLTPAEKAARETTVKNLQADEKTETDREAAEDKAEAERLSRLPKPIAPQPQPVL